MVVDGRSLYDGCKVFVVLAHQVGGVRFRGCCVWWDEFGPKKCARLTNSKFAPMGYFRGP